MKQQTLERKIMWGDLDALGIVFYPRYYEWIDGCSHLFFESLDLNLGQLGQTRQIQFGLVETTSRYFKPGRYHQSICIVTQIEQLEPKTLILKHTIHDSADDTLMLEGREKRICMDVSNPERLKAISIPDDIYAILEEAWRG